MQQLAEELRASSRSFSMDLLQDGEHRMSRPGDLALLTQGLARVLAAAEAGTGRGGGGGSSGSSAVPLML